MDTDTDTDTDTAAQPVPTTGVVLWPGDLDPCDGCPEASRNVEPVELPNGGRLWLCRPCRELYAGETRFSG